MRWMNLEPIRQSEVIQKGKDKDHTLTHIYGIQKHGTEDFIYRAAMEKEGEQTYGHGEREGEGEMYGKSNMENYITYVTQIANGTLLYGSGNSNRGSVSTQGVGWGGRWEGSSKGKGCMYTHG